MTPGLSVDPGLMARLKEAYATIRWQDAPAEEQPGVRAARTALLHDETARVEVWETTLGAGVAVTSGPVGALVLLVEIDRRGPPKLLGARNAGGQAMFPDGAIVAVWGREKVAADSRPRVADLVDLARYALA